jgi:hypothetical protein
VGWTQAVALQRGDRLLRLDPGGAVVVDAPSPDGKADVYNMQVEGLHTYFAGGAPVLVHNESPVTILFPARNLTRIQQEEFAFHLAEQEGELEWLSSQRPNQLIANLEDYQLYKNSGMLRNARRNAPSFLGPRPPGTDAAHALDAVAGGEVDVFVGYRPSLMQQRIGALWRDRVQFIQPGRVHILIPDFGPVP